MKLVVDQKFIQDVFAKYYVIDPPKHVIVLDKPAASIDPSYKTMTFFRGLQPKWRADIIILTPFGNDETLIHEALHAQFMASEPVASVFGKVMVLKFRAIERKRLFSRVWSLRNRERNVNYQACFGCDICRDLSTLKIESPPGSRPVHYILNNYDGR